MPPVIDITGNRYGLLTAIALDKTENNHSYWRCKCDCGKETVVRTDCLKGGNTKSCGCLNYKPKPIIHGEAKTKLYHLYYSIKQRCFNPSNHQFKNYGARGITMCREWKDSYQAFAEWSRSHGYAPGLTIDRINNNGNYEPDNCRWITQHEQTRNTRRNTHIVFQGEEKILVEWCEKYNLKPCTVVQRIQRGWPLEKVFLTPGKGVSTIPKGSTVSIDTASETESTRRNSQA